MPCETFSTSERSTVALAQSSDLSAALPSLLNVDGRKKPSRALSLSSLEDDDDAAAAAAAVAGGDGRRAVTKRRAWKGWTNAAAWLVKRHRHKPRMDGGLNRR